MEDRYQKVSEHLAILIDVKLEDGSRFRQEDSIEWILGTADDDGNFQTPQSSLTDGWLRQKFKDKQVVKGQIENIHYGFWQLQLTSYDEVIISSLTFQEYVKMGRPKKLLLTETYITRKAYK